MGAEVSRPKYNGVDVDNPTVVRYAKNMAKEGAPIEKIVKVIGIPREVAEQYAREARSDKK